MTDTLPPLANSFADLLGRWERLRPEGGLPTRADFPTEALRPWMGNLMVLEVVDRQAGEPDFIYRLHGTHLTELWGQDLTGRRVSDLPEEDSTPLLREYREVFHSRAPLHIPGRRMVRKDYLRVEKAILPLSVKGSEVEQLLVGVNAVGGYDVQPEPAAFAMPRRR